MCSLYLNFVFKILIKGEGDGCGSETVDESGHVMSGLPVAHAGATRCS